MQYAFRLLQIVYGCERSEQNASDSSNGWMSNFWLVELLWMQITKRSTLKLIFDRERSEQSGF